jgi:hypothetical protein
MAKTNASRWTLVVLASALLAIGACSCKDSMAHPPPAPTLPAAWVVKADNEIPREKIFEVEYRLEGKIKALRNTVYEVNGKKVQLNTIVPASPNEGDKIIRILGNMKAQYSYVRKADVIYELVGGNEATEEIKAAHDALAK